MSQIIAVDLGYGFTKISDGKKNIKVISVVGEPVKMDFEIKRDAEDVGNLDVTITDEDIRGRYFVGKLAQEQSSVKLASLSKEKVNQKSSSVLAVVGIGLILPEGTHKIKLATGLPVSHYLDYKEDIKKLFMGKHDVQFHRLGKRVEFEVEDVLVMPQPFGSYFDFILDEKGNIKDDKAQIQDTTGCIIDVGFKTTDIAVCGADFRYIKKASGTFNNGMHRVWELVARALKTKSGVDLKPHDLEPYMSLLEIPLNGMLYDIRSTFQQSLEVVFEEIMTDLQNLSENEKSIELYCGCGGSIIAMKELFKKHIPSMVFPENPQFSNVNGYIKFASFKDRTAAATK